MRVGLELFVMVFAAASLTRLAAYDTITHSLRVWLTWKFTKDAVRVDNASEHGWCRWCVGFWVSLALAVVWWAASNTGHVFGNGLLDIGLTAFALRYSTGLLSGQEKN